MNDNTRCLKSEDRLTNIRQKAKEEFKLHKTSYLFALGKKFWQNFVTWLLDETKEIQVWQKSDGYGNIYWQAYDPITGKSFSSGSEADISMWIEQRYKN
ncbi:hypothetical protein NIES4075_22220 [Tolypothrix sp. NIES-4075]|uniref:hypothetical protein n=1 Tax=Tolypothrix sp. NIES-4075 TaxID=2005459 RepID=UPI000B5C28B0|nr:hypothetical protein [Tolypothrix sp. NIES-4075]GAX41253.1 hypothetical protein NIES4075_22220 [Tolypothrix sp. NIES-4075]